MRFVYFCKRVLKSEFFRLKRALLPIVRLLEELYDKWQMFRLTNKPRHLMQVLTRGFPMRALSPLVQAIV